MALLQTTSKNIRTLSDLLESNFEFGVDDTPFTRFFFANETEPVRKKLFEMKIARPNEPSHFMNASHGVSRLRRGLFAFHIERGIGYRYIKDTFFENDKCGLVEIPFLRVVDPWYGVPKHSPFKEIFKVG